MWSNHTMEYYSTLERMEILAHATTLNLEDIMLSKINAVQVHLYEIPRVVKFVETESKMMVSRG